MKKSLSLLLVIILITSVVFGSCGLQNGPAETPAPTEVPELYFGDIQPKEGDVVALLAGDPYEYLTNYTEAGCSKGLNAKGGNVYYPEPAVISWKYTNGEAQFFTVKVGLNADLSDAKEYLTIFNCIQIPDLYTGSTYYYQINAHTAAGEEFASKVYSFQTEATIRTITVPNTSNTRDLGGWVTEDGTKRVKQGIIYRGATLDSVSRKNRSVITDYYGIKTEIDCREGQMKSPFKDSLKVINCYAPYYVGSSGINSSNKTYRKGLLTELQTFAKAENYPLYFHCQIGRDRTGTLAFLILGLCGVSKTDLYKDYEFSMFGSVSYESNPKVVTNNVDATFKWLEKTYPADTTKETIEAFCLALGLTTEEIEAIRNNILEDLPENYVGDKKANYTAAPETLVKFGDLDKYPNEITVKAGVIPCINVEPDDGEGTIKYAWSSDAQLDGNNRLVANEGDYTYNIKYRNKEKTATLEKKITIHVVE